MLDRPLQFMKTKTLQLRYYKILESLYKYIGGYWTKRKYKDWSDMPDIFGPDSDEEN